MFRKIRPEEIDQNLFSMLNDQWMLVTAGTGERCNTMTASWGGLGVLWRRNVAMCVIRPQRYTMEFVEREGYYTLSFFGDKYRRELALCGSRSGRELDKIRECGFTVAAAEGVRPILRRLSWSSSAASSTGRTWSPGTSPTRRCWSSAIPRRIITGCISARSWRSCKKHKGRPQEVL